MDTNAEKQDDVTEVKPEAEAKPAVRHVHKGFYTEADAVIEIRRHELAQKFSGTQS